MARVVWTESALNDLKEILEFIARDAPQYAFRIGTRIIESPKGLENWPESGGIVPEFDRPDVREVLVTPYRIIYQIRGEECHVQAVIHGSRDLENLYRPDETAE